MRWIKLITGTLFWAWAVWAAEVPILIENSSKYQRLADYTRSTIENTVDQLPRFLISGRHDTLRVWIVSTQNEFQAATGANLPYWVGAVTIFPQDMIVVRSPDLSNATLREYRVTMIHELIHYLQGQNVPLNLTPVWFNEGLATYYSGEFGLPERVLVSKSLWRHRMIPLIKLGNIMKFSQPQAAMAYAESASAIEFLDVVYGSETISRIFNSMQKGIAFDRALSLALDNEEANFEAQWQKYLSQKYNWIFLLDIQNILWLIIPVLVLVAYVSIRRRNKATLRQWNIEEAYERRDEESS